MAMSIRGLLRSNFKFLTSSILKPVSNNVSRSLYSPNALGIVNYADARKNVTNQFEAVSQTFREKMLEFTNEDNKSIIFTEDLKAMLHIVENKKEDIDLMLMMLKKFHAQNNELRFGNYVFGPVVMRAFYYLDVPDVAIEAFKDPQLQGFFDQLTSYQILLTLLYNHKRYSDVRAIYDIIKQKYTGGVMHPQNSINVTFASCYLENTPDSFQYALDLWRELNKKGFEPNRKAFCLIASLAVNQGKPEFALELVSSCPQFRHIECRCIKIKAYIAVNRIDDVTNYLKKLLNSENFDKVYGKPVNFFKDTITFIEEHLDKSEKAEQYSELRQLLKELKDRNLIQDTTLHESLIRTIDRRPLGNSQGVQRTDSNRSNFRGNHRQTSGMRF